MKNRLRYPQYLVWNHTRPDGTTPGQGGLLNVQAATDGGITSCRQGGGPDGPCGPACDPVCVLQTSLNIAISFNPSFMEVWEHDGENPLLYSIAESTTLAMGGQLRGAPAAPTNLRIVP